MDEQALSNYLRNYLPGDFSAGLRANNPQNPAFDSFRNAFYNNLEVAVNEGKVDEINPYGVIFCLAGLVKMKDGKRGYFPTQKARDLIHKIEGTKKPRN